MFTYLRTMYICIGLIQVFLFGLQFCVSRKHTKHQMSILGYLTTTKNYPFDLLFHIESFSHLAT